VDKVVFSEGFKVAGRLSSIIVGLVFYTIIMCFAVEVVGVEGVACVRSEDCKRRDALVVSLIGGAVGAQCSCGAHCLIMVVPYVSTNPNKHGHSRSHLQTPTNMDTAHVRGGLAVSEAKSN
jgi:hypothetical protein